MPQGDAPWPAEEFEVRRPPRPAPPSPEWIDFGDRMCRYAAAGGAVALVVVLVDPRYEILAWLAFLASTLLQPIGIFILYWNEENRFAARRGLLFFVLLVLGTLPIYVPHFIPRENDWHRHPIWAVGHVH